MTIQIRLLPSDAYGCGFSRMREPARVAAALTTDVEIEVIEPHEDGNINVTLHGRIGNERVVGVSDPGCDVLVLQRPAHRHLVEAIPYIQAHGTAVVCEFDDDFDSIDPRHPAWRAYDPMSSPLSNKVWVNLAAQLADLVIVSTPALQRRYGGHGMCDVLPNCVPASYLEVKAATAAPQPLLVGWAGNEKAHPGDLEVIGQGLQTVLERFRGRDRHALFFALGSTTSARALGVEALSATEAWVSLEEYPRRVAFMDVGLVPLRDSAFNRAKSWLKGLEYAALGVPFVASPTEQYRELSLLGAGDLVRSTTPNGRIWAEAIERLLIDEEYRARRAEEGRHAAAQWTYERHAERWLQAWRNAVSLRGT